MEKLLKKYGKLTTVYFVSIKSLRKPILVMMLDFCKMHHTKYKLVFCCNVLKNRFLMVSPCQTELYLIVFYNNKKSLHKGCHKMKG